MEHNQWPPEMEPEVAEFRELVQKHHDFSSLKADAKDEEQFGKAVKMLYHTQKYYRATRNDCCSSLLRRIKDKIVVLRGCAWNGAILLIACLASALSAQQRPDRHKRTFFLVVRFIVKGIYRLSYVFSI